MNEGVGDGRMKQLGYAVLFITFIIIIIPLILVKGCGKNNLSFEDEKKHIMIENIKIYLSQEDRLVEMNFHEYLKGVVAAEMPASFHIEALKAQAVAARTYVYHRIEHYKKNNKVNPEHPDAVVCTDPTHCKAWISKDAAMKNWGILSGMNNWHKISKAVDETKNIIITYNSEPIDAVFHSTSSGRTENSEDIWTNTVAYLRSVESIGEEESPKFTSQATISMEEFKNKLKEFEPEINLDNVNNLIEEPLRSEAGSVKTITIGGRTFKGTEIREIFKLNSANFTLEIDDDRVIFHVKGNGHGVGMSQYGANYLAKQGKSYEEILNHYYSGIELLSVQLNN